MTHWLPRELNPPISGNTWLGLTDQALPVALAHEWVKLPRCGATVVFNGTTRNHSPGRPNVVMLEYEAYEAQVLLRFESIANEMRRQWDDLGRIVLLHRVGAVGVCETSVIVAVSAPHRATAFLSAQAGIDALKSSVPIWKREHWQEGEDWGLGARRITDAATAVSTNLTVSQTSTNTPLDKPPATSTTPTQKQLITDDTHDMPDKPPATSTTPTQVTE